MLGSKNFIHNHILGTFTRNNHSQLCSSSGRLFGSVLKPDICIIGSGPVGAALGCALVNSNSFSPTEDGQKKISIVDAGRLPSLKSYHEGGRVPEPRVVTLSPASLRLLKSFGALQLCNHEYITPFRSMLVYEQAGNSYMHFDPTKEQSLSVKAQDTILK